MYKNSSVLESKAGARANAGPDVQLGKSGATWPSSVVRSRQELPPISNGLSQRHVRADSLEWDGYQVALIAPENRADHADSSAPTLARPAHVLVLPLTWKDLAVLMRADGAHSTSVEANQVFRFGQVGVDFGGMKNSRRGDREFADGQSTSWRRTLTEPYLSSTLHRHPSMAAIKKDALVRMYRTAVHIILIIHSGRLDMMRVLR